MMRAGLHSWSFQKRFADDPKFGPRDFIAIAADMGFADVEILTGAAGGNAGHLGTEDPKEIAALVRYAESKGVRVACFSTYNDFAFTTNEDWRLANIAYIKRWLPLTGDCGVPNIRMLTGYWVRGRSQVKLQQLVLDGIRECAPLAERAGVNMALENHSSVYLEAEDILWLIDQVGSRRLTTCPDPTNWSQKFLKNEADTAERDYVFSSTQQIAPRMTESHLKVFGITEREELAGFGSELDRLIGIYRAAGYEGVIAFEHIGAGDPLAELPRAKAILERAIAKAHSTALSGAQS
jgi:L-ribulose-5-phosphate 3-epimerase UlaE